MAEIANEAPRAPQMPESCVDKYYEGTFEILCQGRNAPSLASLTEPVKVTVRAHKSPGVASDISINVECPHIRGGHGEECGASGKPHVRCPYSLDLPFTIDGGPLKLD